MLIPVQIQVALFSNEERRQQDNGIKLEHGSQSQEHIAPSPACTSSGYERSQCERRWHQIEASHCRSPAANYQVDEKKESRATRAKLPQKEIDSHDQDTHPQSKGQLVERHRGRKPQCKWYKRQERVLERQGVKWSHSCDACQELAMVHGSQGSQRYCAAPEGHGIALITRCIGERFDRTKKLP
jgi:hypothetical protein